MGQLQFLPDHRPLPAHLLAMIEESAWGRVGQALQDGLSANLKGAEGETLFGIVLRVLSYEGKQGDTASAYGPLALLETFLEKGLNPQLSPQRTTITEAVAAGQWPWVHRLLKEGHPVELPDGRPVLFALLEGRMARRLRGLEGQDWGDGLNAISKAKFNVDTRTEIAEIHRVVAALVEHGAKVEALDDDEDAEFATTPLILSVLYGDPVMVDALLSCGASVQAPWHEETSEEYMGQMHPIALAAKEGCTAILDELLGHAGLDVLGLYGADAMHVAASRGHVECLSVLERHGIPFDAPSRSGGFRPLHQAALHGHKIAIDWLLGRGDQWSAPSEFGVTPGAVLDQYHPALSRAYGVCEIPNIIPLKPR